MNLPVFPLLHDSLTETGQIAPYLKTDSNPISVEIEVPGHLYNSISRFLADKPDWSSYRLFKAAVSLFLLQQPTTSDRVIARSYLDALFRSSEPHASQEIPGIQVNHAALDDGKQLKKPDQPEDLNYMYWHGHGQKLRALRAIAELESTNRELANIKASLQQVLSSMNESMDNLSDALKGDA